MQYTENGTPWSSAEVIGLLVGAFLTSVLFVVWLWYKGPTALIPLRILRQRTVAASCLLAFFLYAALLMHTYYLPIYFEAVRNDSAIHAGVNMIPYMCANALFGLIAGIVVSKNGLFAAPAILGCAIGTIGAGLLSTLQVDTSSSMWIGYEILTSVGLGMAVQQGFTAVQTVLPLEDVPIGTAAVVACQSLGGAVFVSVVSLPLFPQPLPFPSPTSQSPASPTTKSKLYPHRATPSCKTRSSPAQSPPSTCTRSSPTARPSSARTSPRRPSRRY